jgi:hypothetical protein
VDHSVVDRTSLQQLLALLAVVGMLLLPAGSSPSPLLASDVVMEAITILASPSGTPAEDGGGTVELEAFAHAALQCAAFPAVLVSCRPGMQSSRRPLRFSLASAAPRAPPSLAG